MAQSTGVQLSRRSASAQAVDLGPGVGAKTLILALGLSSRRSFGQCRFAHRPKERLRWPFVEKEKIGK